ncbi:MAG: enoyl-CoA hydratase/isomerase family protein [Alphaproteobacteria bacterium]|nr:enoyl-CoA hydratase/isomerase family protein [Alphaproteobacteria bacterium]
MAEAVLVAVDGGVGVLTLNRPGKFNCLSTELLDGLIDGMEQFETDPAVRAVLLNAKGPQFCTGADLDEVLERCESSEALTPFIAAIHEATRRFEASPLPVVAAVQGLALAGGMELVMACDTVFAAESARIGCQHARYGLPPGGGGTQRLARLIGLRRALDLMFTARWLDAAEAECWGLFNHVTADEELDARARAYCADLAAKSRHGLTFMKSMARRGLEGPLDVGLALERGAVVAALQHSDVSEGLEAFRSRREPVFP